MNDTIFNDYFIIKLMYLRLKVKGVQGPNYSEKKKTLLKDFGVLIS